MKIGSKKFDFVSFVLAIALVVVFLVSLGIYFLKSPGKRYMFKFESVDKGKSAIEYRYLPSKSGEEEVQLYVSELLLGPKTERSRPVFSPGTKLKFCILRSETLYINLGNDLLYQTGNASEVMTGIELFKSNITSAFPQIRKIELYLEGKAI